MEPTKTVFVLLRATTRWLERTPAERDAFVTQQVRPILARHPGVHLRYFDAEAYSAATSDVLLWEYQSDRAYQSVIEALRETPFWGTFFEVREIVRCVEDGFARHYGVAGFGTTG